MNAYAVAFPVPTYTGAVILWLLYKCLSSYHKHIPGSFECMLCNCSSSHNSGHLPFSTLSLPSLFCPLNIASYSRFTRKQHIQTVNVCNTYCIQVDHFEIEMMFTVCVWVVCVYQLKTSFWHMIHTMLSSIYGIYLYSFYPSLLYTLSFNVHNIHGRHNNDVSVLERLNARL